MKRTMVRDGIVNRLGKRMRVEKSISFAFFCRRLKRASSRLHTAMLLQTMHLHSNTFLSWCEDYSTCLRYVSCGKVMKWSFSISLICTRKTPSTVNKMYAWSFYLFPSHFSGKILEFVFNKTLPLTFSLCKRTKSKQFVNVRLKLLQMRQPYWKKSK